MSIKSRTLFLITGLQVLMALGVTVLGLQSFGDQAQALQQATAGARIAAQAQRVERESALLERAAVDLASVAELLYAARQRLPDEQWHALLQERLLAHFSHLPEALGGGIWFEPELIDAGRRHYGPYVFRDEGRMLFTWDLSTPEYDYHNQPWYFGALPRDWPRERRRPRASYWSEPYRDAASSQALMMTVSAPIHDRDGRVIGLATVDWSLDAMRQLLMAMASPGAQQVLMIERRSARILAYSADPSQVMQPLGALPWASEWRPKLLARDASVEARVELAEQSHMLHAEGTSSGIVLGSLTPIRSGLQHWQGQLAAQLLRVVALLLPVLGLTWLILDRQVRPLQRVLAAIQASLARDGSGQRLLLRTIERGPHSEFSPLIAAMNDIFAEINRDIARIDESNRQLQARQAEIAELNQSLERSINERTFQLEANNAELQRTVSALSALQEQLVEAEKQGSLSRLVAGIAHDINTPLGIAVTAASHLQDQFLAQREALQQAAASSPGLRRLLEDGDEGFRILQGNLARAAALVRSFKQISVDQSGEGRRRFELRAYLDELLLSLRPQHKRLPHTVELDCPRGIELDSYPGAWAQIVTNLVMNSLRHGLSAERPGHIRILVSESGDDVELRVKDDGVGIPADRLPRIFDAFYTTSAGTGGSGLGLAVVRDLAEQRLKGRVSVASRAGEGAEFLIRAPKFTPEAAPGPSVA
jgi:signal transduction histidine kinase